MKASHLTLLLRGIPDGGSGSDRLLLDVLPALVAAAGVSEERIAYEHVLHRHGAFVGHADAIIRADDGSPGVVVEIRPRFDLRIVDQLRSLREAAGAPGSLLLTSTRLWAQLGGLDVDITLAKTTDEESALLSKQLLKALEPGVAAPSPAGDCEGRLQAVEDATTNDDKRESLEAFAAWCIESETGLTVKHRNLRTQSSEIDLVGKVSAGAPEAFSDAGRYFLVECKNWRQRVGAGEIRDFVGKLVKSRCTLGLLFAREGVTGANDSRDALREIRFCYDYLQVSVCVLALDECRAICAGVALSTLVDDRLETLRFDLAARDRSPPADASG